MAKSGFSRSTGIVQTGPGKYSLQLGATPQGKFHKLPAGEAFSFERSEGKIFQKEAFQPGLFSNVKDLTDRATIEDMKKAALYYHNDPLVGRTIDLMTTLSNDGFHNIAKDQEIKQWYDDWAEQVNLEEVLTWIFLEYFRSANVVTARIMEDYKPIDGRKTTKTGKIPSAYTVMNPLLIIPGDASGFNQRELYFDASKFDKKISSDLIGKDKIFSKVITSSQILLNPEYVARILRMTQPYEKYARPMIKRAVPDLYLKDKMKEMDLGVINGMINHIIQVTAGNDEFPASPNQLKKLARIFQEESRSLTVVWNHTLKIEVIRPTDPAWLNKEKYEAVNESIRSAFGISQVLVGGEGGGGNTSFLSIKGFIGNLTEARKGALRWLRKEYREIARTLKFKEVPIPVFQPLPLGDEIRERQIISVLADRGIISYRSAQKALSF